LYTTQLYENPIAKQNGEGVRNHHGGTPIYTSGPTSNKEIVTPEVDEGMKPVNLSK